MVNGALGVQFGGHIRTADHMRRDAFFLQRVRERAVGKLTGADYHGIDVKDTRVFTRLTKGDM